MKEIDREETNETARKHEIKTSLARDWPECVSECASVCMRVNIFA